MLHLFITVYADWLFRKTQKKNPFLHFYLQINKLLFLFINQSMTIKTLYINPYWSTTNLSCL